MTRFSFALLAAMPISLACAHASAGSVGDLLDDFRHVRANGKAGTRIVIDNDSLLLDRRDGFYTSGGRISREYWLHEAGRSTGFGWRIGQELYSPSDIKLPPEQIAPQDHPYAGWLYGGMFRETRRDDGYRTTFGFDLGCLGPCAGGEWTQEKLHRILNQPLPQGWSRQVRNEAGVVLYGEVAPLRWTPHAAVDIVPTFHGRFGNIFTDAGAGITVRAGRLNLRPDAPTLHGYARVDVSAVGYNATLQGGYFSNGNPHTVEPKRAVGEAEIGIVWTEGPYGAGASLTRRSNEIAGLSNAQGAQSFVRFVFSYTP